MQTDVIPEQEAVLFGDSNDKDSETRPSFLVFYFPEDCFIRIIPYIEQLLIQGQVPNLMLDILSLGMSFFSDEFLSQVSSKRRMIGYFDTSAVHPSFWNRYASDISPLIRKCLSQITDNKGFIVLPATGISNQTKRVKGLLYGNIHKAV